MIKWLQAHAKHLYLLALFQLVGGPLVLLPVLVFSKLTVKYSSEYGVKSGVTKVLQSAEWKQVSEKVSQVNADLPTRDKLPEIPTKMSDAKVNFFAIAWHDHFSRFLKLSCLGLQRTHLQTWTSIWPQAPPSPPPQV